MRELWKAIKRGTPMTKQFLWRALEVLGILSLIALTVAAPFIATSLENIKYKILVWVLFYVLIIIFAMALGLMPYWGMRELKNETSKELKNALSKLDNFKDAVILKKDQEDNPQKYIFPYIFKIDASQITNGRNYLTIGYYIPSALTYDWNLTTAKCTLIINNESTDEKDLSVLTIKNNEPNYKYAEITLGTKITPQTVENLKTNVNMKFKLQVKCWDSDNKDHTFTTEESEIVALGGVKK